MLAYYLFKHHHILPSVVHQMTHGERLLCTAFAQMEIDQRKHR